MVAHLVSCPDEGLAALLVMTTGNAVYDAIQPVMEELRIIEKERES